MLALYLCVTGALADSSLDSTWQRYLEHPPSKAVQLAADLASRADAIVSQNLSRPSAALNVSDFDVVVSGGGDLNAYYMGISMVLSRLKLPNSGGPVRFSGASGGGWITFETALKGEARTLESYLSYGLLQEQNPVHFSNIGFAMLLQDRHWKQMGRWQAAAWNATLASLDDKVFLALGCRDPWRTSRHLLMVSEYANSSSSSSAGASAAEVQRAADAFYATGACADILYAGKECKDGGTASGSEMTPLFQDGLRPQLVVNLMRTGFPIQLGGGKFTSEQYRALAARGQDEAAEFFLTGRVARSSGAAPALSWCPRGADVRSNVCKKVQG